MEKNCCAVKPASEKKNFLEYLWLYRPLLLMVMLSALAALVLQGRGDGYFEESWMGIFLVFLAFLKLLDAKGFAEGFSAYDPLAQRSSLYAKIYPYLELLSGLIYLSGHFVAIAALLTATIFAINVVGVVRVIRSGAAVRCACVGAVFQLPVGLVTLFEDVMMIMMSGHCLLKSL